MGSFMGYSTDWLRVQRYKERCGRSARFSFFFFLFPFSFFFFLILFGVGAYSMSSWTQNKTCTIACKVGHSRSLRFFSTYTVILLMLRV
ncbi:hypothetical protein BDV23DRAFT_1700 [Aspergillus alliaceus]|uniref:Uncharacterized protein n=1 Tax=Petromyces alliaceus TaxID=209559 RepID=A0A5N7CR31_PETAA|nr:hypothetical protein BDV23DRAFT_1700 [Aspergillus alliaceus]